MQDVGKSTLKFVSSICITGDLVWVATVGSGLHVYSTTSKKKVGVCEGTSKIFKLVSIECTSCVLALAHKGTHVFAVNDIPQQIAIGSVHKLFPRHSNTMEDDYTDITLAGCYSEELWAVSSSADGISLAVLDSSGTTVAKICEQVRIGRRIKNIAAHSGTNHVLVSDRYYLELWEVQERRLVKELDCSNVCRQTYTSPEYTSFVSQRTAVNINRLSRITSLLCFNNVIYAGTGGGVILVLSTDLQPLTSYHASVGASRYLMGVRSVKNVKLLSRLFSKRVVGSLQQTVASSNDSEIVEKTGRSASLHSISSEASTDMSIVISFGSTYLGATSYSTNVPPSLNPPGDPPSCTTPSYPYLLTKSPNCDVIFTWSKYSIPTGGINEDGEVRFETNIDE